MNVNLSPVFEDYIKQQLDTGMYNNASEIIREALRIKMQQDEVYQAKLIALRAAVTAGLESGEPEPFDVNAILAEAKGRAGLDV
ncbi:type II toxin-antitoxin system ParD family antitoxin [Marinomonas mediterranea]|jgi:putative addiction module antidote protein, CC2985 family|uniref:Antitoxin ParD n=1 Tax=Marinomonas mediterranea (strain ATCC 700492 / JCM 21426 / NBRC 103028 / MMB-1) TaxID=717774 RepID=F2JZ48_MARM1|nr:type II toxin-antitoxin system ParD family antitoxin [Marinomonas mediterranea]ADZ92026.1 addiction module antidote protein, CC2985 family [Marinomonas mediterranea MMB-1]WCN09969.1 type II toxin-antitoxin system ParD family antitoxin [Marinomonas mediterranea]WCN14043.1 type II toxin-antitoxin system ParD family antitoxin [Marinomonas mediterranea]WCN18101.1 type II toxin-antitoxin system ParD family antitoxin [Marinomonas mediterranea MMB-1]